MALALCAPDAPRAQQQPFVERVEVARVLIDARVFDERGRPLSDLDALDFAVTIGGRVARVESAEWVGSPSAEGTGSSSSAAPRSEPCQPEGARAGQGRLVVFLVQRDLEPARMVGLMQIGQLVDVLLQPLTRADRVAVLSFDSRLRIWTDFTGDLDRIRSLLGREVISGRPGPVQASDSLSLVSRLEPERAARTYGIERAMQHIAGALEPLPGAKTLVLLGYGFGRFDPGSGGVLLMDGYDDASAALQRARVSVFALNVTRADYNSLQAGLQTVAAETGGLYASTFRFPAIAIERVSHALAGHYVLFVEKPDLRAGTHRIEVRLASRRGTVLARRTYVSGG